MNDEIWKPIPVIGYDGFYEASNYGRIRRSADHIPIRRGRAGEIRKPQARPPSKSQRSKNRAPKLRPKMILTFGEKRYSSEVGHLVAMAFHGLPKPDQQCNHIDGDPWNNSPDNLEWVTQLENARHAHRNGLLNHLRGEEQPKSKLTETSVREIRLSSKSQRQLAIAYGVSRNAIRQVLTMQKWRHVI